VTGNTAIDTTIYHDNKIWSNPVAAASRCMHWLGGFWQGCGGMFPEENVVALRP